MSSYVVRVTQLQTLFTNWTTHITNLLGTPSQWDESGIVTIEWPALFVPNPLLRGETEETITNRRGRVVPREKPFFRYVQGIWESLQGDQWNRIQWFYYCDDFQGITIRLYDKEHFGRNRNALLYLETDPIGHDVKLPDRVLLRGENLG